MRSNSTLTTITAAIFAVVLNASATNLLTNGNFNALPLLGSNQTDVGINANKAISTNSADTPWYLGCVSGIQAWTYGLPNNGGSDHGVSRATGFGDSSGPRLIFINNWERMMSQTVTPTATPGMVACAQIQFGTLGAETDGGRAGTFYLVAGEADPANRDKFSSRSIILSKIVAGNPTFTQRSLDVSTTNRALVDLTLVHAFTNGDPALALPITVAFRTEWGSAGPTYWENASLDVSVPLMPLLSAQPVSLTNLVNSTAVFSITALGSAPLSYQWRKDGINLADGGRISGAATARLGLSTVQGADTGGYSVVVSNGYGSVTSSVATLAVVNYRPAMGPRGLASDASGNIYLAETTGNDVQVFTSAGSPLLTIGESGTLPGQLQSPSDVAVAGSTVYVVDSLNHRVQQFTTAGGLIKVFGAQGSAAGNFQQPNGCGLDSSGRLYVADTGNHRVQRFLDNGALDISWGLQGVVGTTGVVKRDHSGFDRPMDVAVNPLNQNVYVADYGNCRLEVFNSSGQYLRSFIAVYHPNALAFAPNGDLFIAGEDPNENYPSYDGRLRLLKAGDELSSRHFSGGLDDLERQLTGVCVTPDSSIIVSDPMNRRLVRTDLDFAVPLDSLQVSATGTVVQIKWKTRVAARGSLRFGASSAVTSRLDEAQTGNEHSLTINGLTPNSRLYYSLGFADSFDGQTRWTPVDVINTGCAPGQHQFLRLKAAGLIYTDTQAGSGYKAMSAADLAAARARFQKVAQFYWRNSGFKVWPDIQIIELNRDITESSYNVWNSAENDLAALGYGPADNFDAVWAASPQAGGNFGGGGSLFGRSVAMCEWCTADDFVAIHEINHTLDSMYDLCGLPKYQFNHGTWAVAGGVGQGFALNGQILRNMLPQNLTATVAPYTKIMTAPDADNDGLPDSSPAGLLNPLAVTEATLGSSTTSSDTDGDGVSDRAEAMLLIAHGSNLLATDSDEDGVADGNDLNPAYRMQDQILKATPLIDGTITPGEGWTVMTRNWGFTNELLVTDPNHLQSQVTTYAAWDDHFFYLAMKGPGCSSTISLDGSADGWGFGPDNYRLTLNNSVDSKSVKINVGVPDLFRQIDDDGQYGEFYDTDPQWKLPYQGRYFYDKPTEGAGATGRLVTEADLNYRRGGTGTNQVWEVAIPWSSKTAFRGSAGKLLAINWDVDGDVLFETDHAARLKLVTSPLPANPSVTYSRRATTVRWTAVPGIRYQVCTAESLQGPWRYLTDLVGQGDNTSFTDDGLLTGSAPENNLTRFYSLRPSP